MSANKINIRPTTVRAIPILSDLRRLQSALGGTTEPEVFTSTLESHDVLVGRVAGKRGRELLIVAGERYPTLPPIVLVEDEEGNTRQVPVHWRLDAAPEERLAIALGEWRQQGGSPVEPKSARRRTLRRAAYFRFRRIRKAV